MTQTTRDESPARGRRRQGRQKPRSSSQSSRFVPLRKRSSSHFEPGIRKRGQQDFVDGRVRMEVDDARCRARVEDDDGHEYAVGVDWSREATERILSTFCECRRFDAGRTCQHVWATLLALAETGPENQPQGKDRLSVRRDRAASWEDLGVPISAATRVVPVEPTTEVAHTGRRKTRSRTGRRRSSSGADTWRSQLASLRHRAEMLASGNEATQSEPEPGTGIHLLINTAASRETEDAVLDLFSLHTGGSDRSAKLKQTSVDPGRLEDLLRPTADSDGNGGFSIVTALPSEPPNRSGRSRRGKTKAPGAAVRRIRLPRGLFDPVLPQLCAHGVLGWWEGRVRSQRHHLTWDDGPPWHFVLRLEVTSGVAARLVGCLERNGQSVPLTDAQLILPGEAIDENGHSTTPAFVVFAETLARLELERARDVPWIALLREAGEIGIPTEDLEEAMVTILELPGLPRLEAPERLQLAQESSAMSPRLVLEPDDTSVLSHPPLIADLTFVYGDIEVDAGDSRPSIIDWEQHTFLQRDMDQEHRALIRLLETGFRPEASGYGEGLELDPRELPMVVEPLLLDGWTIEVRGRSLRPPNPPALRVESGIDWFELSGSLDFEGDQVELADILKAIQRGDRFIDLSDGSRGLLPADWVETWGSLAELAHDTSDDGLRFLPSQALLVDALLTAMPPAVDRAFDELREKLRSFDKIKPKKEPRGFSGTLRQYQRHGLGWLEFLREFGLGGVLADDMGLGKTVQVLALLRANRTPSKTTGLPSLVVAPRSLVYNWIDEAARFTPKLKVVEYAGPGREALQKKFSKYDAIVTTYGTLRRDIGFLSTVELDTVILDEAQAIKNRDSLAAKASRALVARHRLALTGTPIENHLGELGSLFEFLNPGLLGRLPALDALATGRAASKKELQLVAEGIRPFVLRRTKAQVLPDLPPKTEQVLFCSLRPKQRELYDQLKAAYQASLLETVESKGVGGSAIQVLEALLRLRQVACHPGLVNEEWEEAGSAKLEALFEQVSEVLAEGHKVLVFSQFTSLLAFVRRHFDEQGIEYAYLDGKTRNRGEVVERFQTDPSCNLFLISLKAGGTGLNLTAAGYVFLLDPWWNPAVEAQAIDRAHRIGQTQPVFSYRMIARDTVEEKILDLQASKRELADAVLSGEGQQLRDLTADDLRTLLS